MLSLILLIDCSRAITSKNKDNGALKISLSQSMLFESVSRNLAVKVTNENCYKHWCGMYEAFLPIYNNIQWMEIHLHLLAFIICIKLKGVDN